MALTNHQLLYHGENTRMKESAFTTYLYEFRIHYVIVFVQAKKIVCHDVIETKITQTKPTDHLSLLFTTVQTPQLFKYRLDIFCLLNSVRFLLYSHRRTISIWPYGVLFNPFEVLYGKRPSKQLVHLHVHSQPHCSCVLLSGRRFGCRTNSYLMDQICNS